MPFIAHTPESLLARSDSKDPATTCRGITSNGRPCRRSVGSPAKSSRVSPTSASHGVVAVVSLKGKEDNAGAAFFCWQHKEQAEQLVNKTGGKQMKLVTVETRTSIDTLINRIGVLELDGYGDDSILEGGRAKGRGNDDGSTDHSRHGQRQRNRNKSRTRGSDPSISEKHGRVEGLSQRHVERRPQRSSLKVKRPGFFATLCCMSSHDNEDFVEVVRHRRRAEGASRPAMSSNQFDSSAPVQRGESKRKPARMAPVETAARFSTSQHSYHEKGHYNEPPNHPHSTQSPSRSTHLPNNQPSISQTSNFLSIIPANTSPSTAASLLVELSKPISPHDDEGYIYIFWLTPSSASGPPSPGAVSSLLSTSPQRPSVNDRRRPSDILQTYAGSLGNSGSGGYECQPSNGKKTILLKIGRASNVHRRMSEWTRQCGYDLTLLRWYPHILSSPSDPPPSNSTSPPIPPTLAGSAVPSPSTPPRVRKVPHAHRVERLIHLELAEKGVRRQCATCGKEHREWFEVEGTREGIRGVDEVVRRWVGWSERYG